VTEEIISVGIDLSLRATGLVAFAGETAERCMVNGTRVTTSLLRTLAVDVVNTDGMTGLARLNYIECQVVAFFRDLVADGYVPTVAMFEAPGFSSQVAHALGTVHGVVKLALYRFNWKGQVGPRMCEVAPGTLKKFVCDDGAAEKSVIMKKLALGWDFDSDDDNVCDAAACALAGIAVYGKSTAAQRKVLIGKIDLHDRFDNRLSPRGDREVLFGRVKKVKKRKRVE
jgi:hypothetical protein